MHVASPTLGCVELGVAAVPLKLPSRLDSAKKDESLIFSLVSFRPPTEHYVGHRGVARNDGSDTTKAIAGSRLKMDLGLLARTSEYEKPT